MEKIVRVENLKKNYGSLAAVKGINFNIHKGEIFALIGPNGAGKTTTLRMISTILSPTSGNIYVDNLSVIDDAKKVRECISYLPEEAGAYKNLTGIAYLKFMASIFAESTNQKNEFVEYAKEISGLNERLKNKIATYSKGMTRKLLLSRAVMTRPKLAILDEPTSGLDVINALEIRKLIKKLADSGMSVLVSSHNMLEIEFLSDRVGIIDKGILYKIGSPKDLKAESNSNNLEEVFINIATKGAEK